MRWTVVTLLLWVSLGEAWAEDKPTLFVLDARVEVPADHPLHGDDKVSGGVGRHIAFALAKRFPCTEQWSASEFRDTIGFAKQQALLGR
jgi:hypothetical protein